MSFSAAYRDFVAAHSNATVWHDPDFLQALTEDVANWQSFEVVDGTSCLGVWPVYLKPTRAGISLTMPPLMRYMFPLLSTSLTEAQRNRVLQSLVNQAIAASVKLDFYWPPFMFEAAKDLKQIHIAERTTYLGNTQGSPEDLLGRANKSARRRLRRAMEFFTISRGELTEDAMAMLRSPFEKQELKTPYREASFLRAFTALHGKGQATCHQVMAPDGTLAGAAVSLHDRHRLYLLAVGSRTDLENVNAGSLANFDMLRLANERNLPEADFLGSMLPGPAENRRQLGGKPVTYPHLYADTKLWTKALRRWRMR